MLILSVECDLCGTSELGNRTEARERCGFARRKILGEWKDVCPVCVKGYPRKRVKRSARRRSP